MNYGLSDEDAAGSVPKMVGLINFEGSCSGKTGFVPSYQWTLHYHEAIDGRNPTPVASGSGTVEGKGKGSKTTYAAAYGGLRSALRWVVRLDRRILDLLLIRSNSQFVINCVQHYHAHQKNPQLAALHADCRALLEELKGKGWTVGFQSTPKGENSRATPMAGAV